MIKLFKWYADGMGTFFFATEKIVEDYYSIIIRDIDANVWTKSNLHGDTFQQYQYKYKDDARPNNKLCEILIGQIFEWAEEEE
jgi:hypothetical protein